MSSKQHKVENLHEQPWYDYDECMRAVQRVDNSWKFLAGTIFSVFINSPNVEESPHQFFALKLCEGGEVADRYRMCLYPGPLIAQRVLRGLEEPPKKKPRSQDSQLARGFGGFQV